MNAQEIIAKFEFIARANCRNFTNIDLEFDGRDQYITFTDADDEKRCYILASIIEECDDYGKNLKAYGQDALHYIEYCD